MDALSVEYSSRRLTMIYDVAQRTAPRWRSEGREDDLEVRTQAMAWRETVWEERRAREGWKSCVG